MQNQQLQQGKYQITRLFGQGKVVSYFEALDTRTNEKVLLKKIESSLSSNPDSKNLFDFEANFLERIKHEGFLRVLDHFTESNGHFLVMESVDGKNIGDLLKKSDESFAVPDVVNWCEQTLEALNYLHSLSPKILFLNLKPQNFHVTSSGKIKLLSTGVSVPGNVHQNTVIFDSANIAYSALELIWQKLDAGTTRVILNDYDERSEQVLLLPPDRRTDLFAVGAVIYQLLTGQPAVDALERSIEILEGHNDPIIVPSKLNPEISPEIEAFLLKALEIRRENRFTNALEMRTEIVSAFNVHRERKAEKLRSEASKAPDLRAYRERIAAGELKRPSRRTEAETLQATVSPETFRQKHVAAAVSDVAAVRESVDLQPDIAPEEIEETIVVSVEPDVQTDVVAEEWQEEFDVVWDMSEKTETDTEFAFLLGENEKKRNPLVKFAAVFGLLIALGAGAFGVLKVTSSASSAPPVTVPDVVSDSPSVQTPSQPETPAETETVNDAESDPSSFAADQTPEKPAEVSAPNQVRSKPVQIAESKKPEAPAPAVQDKKKVSVDDLINDSPKKKVTVDDLIKID